MWLALSLLLPAAFAANDVVLRINSSASSVLAGESTVPGHVGEIDVIAFNWGLQRAGSASTANVQNLTLTKRVDKASTSLMLSVFQATRFPTAVLFVRNQGANALDFFKVTMTDVAVVSYTTSGAGDGSLVESVSFSFNTIKFDYQPQNPDGTANGALITAGWDITRNMRL